jgi:predicted metal-dependent enzyme (double-stranded beta helix superfamily)
MFETERFIEDCQLGIAEGDSHMGVRQVVARAVANPSELIDAVGEPIEAGVKELFRSPRLTILNVVWAPRMNVMPHDHRMWAVIGIYVGGEDNIFWRRVGHKIEAAGARALRAKDAVPLGPDIIHSVTNPIEKFTGAIHVYGGDFFATSRSEWDPETFAEAPYKAEKTIELFAKANVRHVFGQELVY